MNPNRFVVGERVRYGNHVTNENLGLMEVIKATADTITARTFFGSKEVEFNPDGIAKHSCNLSIQKLR